MGAVAAVPVARALGGGEGSEEQRKHRALRASPWMGLCMNWLRRMEDAWLPNFEAWHSETRSLLAHSTASPVLKPQFCNPHCHNAGPVKSTCKV
jgi:hypothetical protein